MKIKFFISFFLLFFILNINLTTASGIGVSPDKLIFDKNNPEKEITIFNLNDYSTDYTVSVKNNPDLFDFSEKNFAIEKNSSKKISVKVNNLKNDFEDIIYIRQLSSNNLLPGVGIKVIISKEKEFYNGKEIFIGSVILLFGVLAYVKHRKT